MKYKLLKGVNFKMDEFKDDIIKLAKINNVQFTDSEIEKLYKYMQLLQEWNEKMNLTAIIEQKEVILKHFIDSAVVNKYISNKKNLIDVGTGAGLPGMVLKIINDDLNVTLLDALNKRITFLNEVIQQENLEKINAIHGRAEEYGQNEEYREQYDVVISRAVANMNVLLEYMLPFVKVGGLCICMKSLNVDEEIEKSTNVIQILGGELEKVEKIFLKDENGEILERDFVIIRKKCSTDKLYPRNSNKINKKPLI